MPSFPDALGLFQSTPPVRGATYFQPILVEQMLFQSTPPVRGATA